MPVEQWIIHQVQCEQQWNSLHKSEECRQQRDSYDLWRFGWPLKKTSSAVVKLLNGQDTSRYTCTLYSVDQLARCHWGTSHSTQHVNRTKRKTTNADYTHYYCLPKSVCPLIHSVHLTISSSIWPSISPTPLVSSTSRPTVLSSDRPFDYLTVHPSDRQSIHPHILLQSQYVVLQAVLIRHVNRHGVLS